MRRAAAVIVLTFVVAITAPAVAGAADVRAAAGTALVTTADLPPGWTASEHRPDNDDAALAKDLASCTGRPVVKKKVVATGDDIVDPSDSFKVTSKVSVYRSAAAAKKQYKLYQSPKFAGCAQERFETTPVDGEGGSRPRSAEVGRITLGGYGDRTVGYALRAEIPDRDGGTVEITSVQVAVLEGRAIARYQFNGIGEIFDEGTGKTVLAKVDRRFDAATL